jgi:hypothetical protein
MAMAGLVYRGRLHGGVSGDASGDGLEATDSVIKAARPYVRYWHKADMLNAMTNVRFEGNNGHDADVTRCLLMTHSGHINFRVMSSNLPRRESLRTAKGRQEKHYGAHQAGRRSLGRPDFLTRPLWSRCWPSGLWA